MHRKLTRTLAPACLAVALFAPVVAFAASDVTVALTADKVTQNGNREVLVAADHAKPGETLEYRAVYRNTSLKDVRELVATLPIPTGMEYLPGSATPAAPLASVDGRTFAPVPLVRTEHASDGRTVTRTVPASEYRALRWSLGALEARQSRTVTARVRVAPLAVAAAVR